MEAQDQWWVGLIQTVGLGGVLWFVLIRLEAAIKENSTALSRLSMQIALLIDRSARAGEGVQQLLDDVEKVRR